MVSPMFEWAIRNSAAMRASTIEDNGDVRLATSRGDSLQQAGIAELSARTRPLGPEAGHHALAPGDGPGPLPRYRADPNGDSLVQTTSDAPTRRQPQLSLLQTTTDELAV